MKKYDAIVIGGGPAGVTATLYLLRAGVAVAWVEKMTPGGQILLTDWIDNYPGFPDGARGYELADTFAKHLEGFTFDKYTDEVREFQPARGKNRLLIGDEWVECKTLIICSGAIHKNLDVPGEDEFAGHGVSYCAICDGQFFRDRVVGCVGGGDSALEEAKYLSKLASKVYLIHRRDSFRAAKVNQMKVLDQPKIEILYDTVVEAVKGESEMTGLQLANTKTGESFFLEMEGVFIYVGIRPQDSFFPSDLELDEGGFVKTDTEMRTNLSGIFAAGDIRSKRCRQVTTAVGDGATAAYSAGLFLDELENE